MRAGRSLLQVALCLSTLGSVASAAEWPRWLPNIDALIVRDDSSASGSSTATTSQASATGTPDGGTTGSATDGGDMNTAEPTKSGGKASGSGSGTAAKTKTTGHKTFAPDSPAGGVNMLTPAANADPSPLYKISDYVTWSWNYTSLQGTPSAIDLLVSCSSASATWTLTQNMSFATNVDYVWNTTNQANDPQQPLGVNIYTLLVKDSSVQITDSPEPGYLGTYAGFTFGLYTAQPYTKFPDWTCPGSCSFALSMHDRQALGLAVTMSIISVLSFTWFVSGLNLQ